MTNTCPSGKRSFVTEQLAEDVLIELWSKNEYTPGKAPIAIYRCEDCGNYHLTSRSPMNEKLADAIAKGHIKLQREAHRWMDKLKKK